MTPGDERVELTARDGVRLVGTLTRPAAGEDVSAALLLNGSGPLDRDSNMPGQVLNVAPALASALAERGRLAERCLAALRKTVSAEPGAHSP